MSKVKYSIAWGIWVVLIIGIMFLVADTYDIKFGIIMIFTVISFIVDLILILFQVGFKNDDKYLKIAPVIILNGYMIFESALNMILVLAIKQISIKMIVMLNLIAMCIAGLLFMGSIGGNEHISKVESRQKDHHKEL